ncbi:MAG TPA: DUF1015 domain-containing protein [Bacteroidota bacterium]|nr:DUF1015 domain-containing protein [Bacteroidota bacterium]
MAHIKPFRGYCYNTDRIRLDDVVAPPYDVISPLRRDNLYRRSPYNCIRLILGREPDPYGSAARCFTSWKNEGILLRDPLPAVYLLAQKFRRTDGEEAVRTGIIAACRLEEFGAGTVFPHERTLSTPREDRRKLLDATGALFSQIFGLYDDTGGAVRRMLAPVMAGPPDLRAEFDGVENSVWKATDQGLLLGLQTAIADQKVVIADGHHRYETALEYARHCRTGNPVHTGTEAYNFVPMFLTPVHDRGLAVLPTHRLISGVRNFSAEQFLMDLGKGFLVEKADGMDAVLRAVAIPSDPPRIGLILGGGNSFHLLTPGTSRGRAVRSAMADALDVVVLERNVFTSLLGMTQSDIQKKKYLEYEKDPGECRTAVEQGFAQAAFLLQPPVIDRIKSVAEAGVVLPQKSTYFYPKLLSGVITYTFSEHE